VSASEALKSGELLVLPTDTVYGLVCTAYSEAAATRLYSLKGRQAIQPTAVVFADVQLLLETLPELDDQRVAAVRSLLPGPYTLVLPNPGQLFPWLNAERPEAIGVRVPMLPPESAAVLGHVGAVVATSANLPGGPDPRRLSDVPRAILKGVAATVDGGELGGVPSTVLDLTRDEPEVLRHGAADPAVAIAAFHAARRQARGERPAIQ
jgi:L-threonylcarbamoyladenylate synthase